MNFLRLRGGSCSTMAWSSPSSNMSFGFSLIRGWHRLSMSLGKYNTAEDMDYILEVLPRVVEGLRKMSPLTPKEKVGAR